MYFLGGNLSERKLSEHRSDKKRKSRRSAAASTVLLATVHMAPSCSAFVRELTIPCSRFSFKSVPRTLGSWSSLGNIECAKACALPRLAAQLSARSLHASVPVTTVSGFRIPHPKDGFAFRSTGSPVARLFGSKRGVPDSPPGETNIFNEQTALPDLDIAKIKRAIHIIRETIGYPTYDVSLILTDDEEMREANLESRGVDSPTDILSFPFSDNLVEPGELFDPDFDHPDYYCLGDMMLDVPYVLRRIEEDKKINESNEDREVADTDDDRGVSGAMSTEYDPEKRICMLLIHGILHLVGFDHIEDDDYELMVAKEDDILEILHKRMNS